jgi:DNA-binding transcriptional MerR regulator
MSSNTVQGATMSEAMRQTGYCESYLRRLEKLGVIIPERDDLNRRRFSERLIGQLIERRASINRAKRRA